VATLTVRGLDDELRERLRRRAAENGRSMEAEVRAILRDALTRPSGRRGLGRRIHQRFAAAGGIDLELPARTEAPRAADMQS
jgi:plasmid stability protein